MSPPPSSGRERIKMERIPQRGSVRTMDVFRENQPLKAKAEGENNFEGRDNDVADTENSKETPANDDIVVL